jgi:hypothetical protein
MPTSAPNTPPPPQDLKVLEVSVEEIRSGVIIKKNKISTQEHKTKKSKFKSLVKNITVCKKLSLSILVNGINAFLVC